MTTKQITAHIVGPTEGWVLEPASPRRPWMDDTNGFAYRCLPLAIANQAGWVVRCPASFTGVWSGESGNSATTLTFPENFQTYKNQITSHFGWGIITFSLPWLFRTSKGIALLVHGPMNCFKPGVAPLHGVVETDWATSTFTMNWKIVDPDRVVRFERGEPICMLTPYPIALVEEMRAEVRALDDDPKLAQEYRAWANSRNAFNTNPQRKAEDWQKDYVQGRTAQGGRAEEHRSRLTVQPFRTRHGA